MSGYAVASNLWSLYKGDKEHYVYYTKEEKEIILHAFGRRWAD